MFGCPALQETWKPQKVAHAIVGSSCGLVLLRRQGRDSSPLSDWITRQGPLCFREAAGAVTLPPVNSGPVREHKCQASGNSICHLGVHFPLDDNPSSLGEMYIPAFVVWFAKIPHGSL